MEKFSQQHCVPCEGKVKALGQSEVQSSLAQVPGWQTIAEGNKIYREFTFKNFIEAVSFINTIKDIAEKEMHHPDIHLTRYKHLRVDLYTHALNGLTVNDFIVAAKINEVAHV